MYRIEWKSLLTGYTGHGNWYTSESLIKDWVNYLNNRHEGEIVHSIGTK